MATSKEKLTAAKGRLGGIAKAAPGAMSAFTSLAKEASSDGRFTSAQKELIATSIAVATGCDDCIVYHVDAAKRHGAEEADLVEALTVAIEMGGGPALMYAGKALEAFREL